tara:strand:+ start:95 stop:997 length:903 start_codon:yes stop_codon:yes gene_type:complete
MSKNFFLKFLNKKKYLELKYKHKRDENISIYNENIKIKILSIQEKIEKKNELNFLHSGHLGDIIYSLPTIKKISQKKKCNLFIEKNKLNSQFYYNHPSGNTMINEKSLSMLLPLLKSQNYLNTVKEFQNEEIDVNLNLFREMPFNIVFHSIRWYLHLAGVQINTEESFLDVGNINDFKNKITILRSPRYRNQFIDYNFLSNFKNIVCIGLESEFLDLKKEIKNLEFYNCKDFLEMAKIINSSKFFIGNLCFAYSVAEGLKKPRLLEACPDFPVLFPIGVNSYDAYHQIHFEKFFQKLNSL